MFASKTTRLLGALEREHYRSTREDDIILIKHSIDTRHETHVVKTHHGLIKHATLSASLLRDVVLEDYVRVVCIDEGQFFADLDVVCHQWADRGINVYVSCLDLDKDRRPWEVVGRLLCLATRVEKCTAVCECKQDAVFSFFHAPVLGEDRILVGDGNLY